MKMNGFLIEELENMIPWERESYLNLLDQHLTNQEEQLKNK